jgi:DNA-binding NarL/FixJ family response regulator
MPNDVLRVLIADDDIDIRTILTDYLTHCGYEVWAASDGEQTLALAEAHSVDVALLDVVMPSMSGVELIPQLQSLQPGMVIILLTAYGTISQAVEAMRLGAFDYLEKPFQPKQIQAIVERAWKARQTQVQALRRLTRRERDVLLLLTQGLDNIAIADKLCVSVNTIHSHNKRIYSKLGVADRAGAIAFVLQHRLLDSP